MSPRLKIVLYLFTESTNCSAPLKRVSKKSELGNSFGRVGPLLRTPEAAVIVILISREEADEDKSVNKQSKNGVKCSNT